MTFKMKNRNEFNAKYTVCFWAVEKRSELLCSLSSSKMYSDTVVQKICAKKSFFAQRNRGKKSSFYTFLQCYMPWWTKEILEASLNLRRTNRPLKKNMFVSFKGIFCMKDPDWQVNQFSISLVIYLLFCKLE